MGVTGVSDQISLEPKTSLGAVKADIESALNRRATADAKKITVDVHGGDVTSSGTVHSWFERDRASDSAWGTPGVHKVVNNISVAYRASIQFEGVHISRFGNLPRGPSSGMDSGISPT